MDLQMAFSTSFFRLFEFESFSVVEERVDLPHEEIKMVGFSKSDTNLVALNFANAASLSVFTCCS